MYRISSLIWVQNPGLSKESIFNCALVWHSCYFECRKVSEGRSPSHWNEGGLLLAVHLWSNMLPSNPCPMYVNWNLIQTCQPVRPILSENSWTEAWWCLRTAGCVHSALPYTRETSYTRKNAIPMHKYTKCKARVYSGVVFRVWDLWSRGHRFKPQLATPLGITGNGRLLPQRPVPLKLCLKEPLLM